MIDFDEVLDNRDRHLTKWEAFSDNYGVPADTGIPLWVADMDFRAPPPVNEALQKMVDHGVHGYYGPDDSFREAQAGWMARRHDWAIEPEWALQTHGLGNGLSVIINACSEPGEAVIIFSPVYHSFARIIKANDRRVHASPLAIRGGRFHMDLDALAASLTGDEKIMFLCSPHNPGGRIWSADELRDVALFCERHDIIMVSDEIHHDLIMPGHSHTILAKVAPEISDRLITLVATSKTFNIAGIETGSLLIPDPALRQRVARVRHAMNISNNRFGMLMAEAAYRGGDEWLDTLLPYLDSNRRLMNEAIGGIPGLSVMNLEATYLAWVDFSGTGMEREQFTSRIRNVGLAPSAGQSFGPEGELCMRFNIACRRALLDEAMARLAEAFSDLQ
ncbi:MAG: MalY/PatB family protein [Pseudomonadota bacterium]|nr:MalY/PatB family protein [Pseudomonadota bacterium]